MHPCTEAWPRTLLLDEPKENLAFNIIYFISVMGDEREYSTAASCKVSDTMGADQRSRLKFGIIFPQLYKYFLTSSTPSSQ